MEVLQIQFIAVGLPGLGHGCLVPWYGHISYAKLACWTFFQWCSYVSLLLLLEEFHTFPATRSENSDIISTSPSYPAVLFFAQYMARQWTLVLRLLLGAFGRFARIFFVKENSDPVLLSWWSSCYAEWRSAHRRYFSLPELVALENSDITSTSPSHLAVPHSLSRCCLKSCFRQSLRRGGFFGGLDGAVGRRGFALHN